MGVFGSKASIISVTCLLKLEVLTTIFRLSDFVLLKVCM